MVRALSHKFKALQKVMPLSVSLGISTVAACLAEKNSLYEETGMSLKHLVPPVGFFSQFFCFSFSTPGKGKELQR